MANLQESQEKDKFTPGEWSIHNDFYIHTGKWGIDHPKECKLIATTHDREVGLEQSKANARLIAAAPDLLAACENVVGACDNQEAIDPFFWPIVKQCREALDKARGPQP